MPWLFRVSKVISHMLLKHTKQLTLMSWISHEFADHRLNYTYIAIKCAAEKATKQRHPEVHREPHDKEGCNSTETSHYEYWPAAYPIR